MDPSRAFKKSLCQRVTKQVVNLVLLNYFSGFVTYFQSLLLYFFFLLLQRRAAFILDIGTDNCFTCFAGVFWPLHLVLFVAPQLHSLPRLRT